MDVTEQRIMVPFNLWPTAISTPGVVVLPLSWVAPAIPNPIATADKQYRWAYIVINTTRRSPMGKHCVPLRTAAAFY
jgi:hypothetical protein